mmetsp:Transcript_9456/g.15178  ORF Transcript_9456/g.15178 Transcript_9456/m.15178 type:complete len:134 (-) Transcript_9456:241-642(-)
MLATAVLAAEAIFVFTLEGIVGKRYLLARRSMCAGRDVVAPPRQESKATFHIFFALTRTRDPSSQVQNGERHAAVKNTVLRTHPHLECLQTSLRNSRLRGLGTNRYLMDSDSATAINVDHTEHPPDICIDNFV